MRLGGVFVNAVAICDDLPAIGRRPKGDKDGVLW
jgi:hypothetical protein